MNATTTKPQQTNTTADGKPTTKPNRNTRAWRSAFLAPLTYFLGSIAWIIGAGLLCASQPRTGANIDGSAGSEGLYDAAGILFVIASCLFILAAFINLIATYAEVALLKVGNRTPGIGRLLIHACWWELLGAIILLIGSGLFLGATVFRTASAGVILWLIGSFIYLLGAIAKFIVAMVVGSVTALMPEMVMRQRAWFHVASTVKYLLGWIFFTVGAAAMTVLLGPGFLLFGALLWLVAASLWALSFLTRCCGHYHFDVPVMAFATAGAATSGIVAGTASQAGMTGQTKGAESKAVEQHRAVTTSQTEQSMASNTTTTANTGATEARMATTPGQPQMAV